MPNKNEKKMIVTKMSIIYNQIYYYGQKEHDITILLSKWFALLFPLP